MARAHMRLTQQQIEEVKAKMGTDPSFTIQSPEFKKVLTGRHADPNLLTVDEYWLVEKFLVRIS